eukprot:768026-Hanusia_phi.AAC.1
MKPTAPLSLISDDEDSETQAHRLSSLKERGFVIPEKHEGFGGEIQVQDSWIIWCEQLAASRSFVNTGNVTPGVHTLPGTTACWADIPAVSLRDRTSLPLLLMPASLPLPPASSADCSSAMNR